MGDALLSTKAAQAQSPALQSYIPRDFQTELKQKIGLCQWQNVSMKQAIPYLYIVFTILFLLNVSRATRSKSVGEEQLEVTDKKIFFYIGAAEALSQVRLPLLSASLVPAE